MCGESHKRPCAVHASISSGRLTHGREGSDQTDRFQNEVRCLGFDATKQHAYHHTQSFVLQVCSHNLGINASMKEPLRWLSCCIFPKRRHERASVRLR
jgi:hypothetical protein